jgi:hypothetical protein
MQRGEENKKSVSDPLEGAIHFAPVGARQSDDDAVKEIIIIRI